MEVRHIESTKLVNWAMHNMPQLPCFPILWGTHHSTNLMSTAHYTKRKQVKIAYHQRLNLRENAPIQHANSAKKKECILTTFQGKLPCYFVQKKGQREEKEGRKERKIWHTLLALGTSSCNAFILSAILSLRSCNKRVASVSEWTQLKVWNWIGKDSKQFVR